MVIIVAAPNGSPSAMAAASQPQAAPASGVPVGAMATITGPQGPVGPQGNQGIQGPPGPMFPGFGQVTYTDRVSGPEDVFPAGVRQQIKLGSSMTVQNLLNPPFDQHTFLVNNRIMGRAMGDFYDITVNLLVTAQQGNASLKVDIDVGSPLGPTGSSGQILTQSAGTQERATFPLIIQVLANMLQNGAGIYLTSNVACMIVSEAIVIRPASTQPNLTP